MSKLQFISLFHIAAAIWINTGHEGPSARRWSLSFYVLSLVFATIAVVEP